MDSAGDCAEIWHALHELGLRFVIKLKADQSLVNAALGENRWHVTERDDAGQPTERVAPEEIPREYDGRAEIETMIRDLKHSPALGKVPSGACDANHAMFLLKLLAHNLLRRYARHLAPQC